MSVEWGEATPPVRPRCQCPVIGALDHPHGPCPGVPTRYVRRDGQLLHLCCNCDLRGDIPVTTRQSLRLAGMRRRPARRLARIARREA